MTNNKFLSESFERFQERVNGIDNEESLEEEISLIIAVLEKNFFTDKKKIIDLVNRRLFATKRLWNLSRR